jgi:hypothetical protein
VQSLFQERQGTDKPDRHKLIVTDFPSAPAGEFRDNTSKHVTAISADMGSNSLVTSHQLSHHSKPFALRQ